MVNRPLRVLSPDLRHVIVSVNPRAGPRSGAQLVEQLVDLLTLHHYTVDVLADIEQVAARAASRFAAGELRTVVAAGGDGTAREVASGVLAARRA